MRRQLLHFFDILIIKANLFVRENTLESTGFQQKIDIRYPCRLCLLKLVKGAFKVMRARTVRILVAHKRGYLKL